MKIVLTSCPKGYFALTSNDCHTLLKCNEIKNLPLEDLIGFGAVKQVYKSSWNNFTIVIVIINNLEYLDDFHHGLNLLIELSPSEYISELIGYCKNSNVYVTKFYPLGSLSNFSRHLPENFHDNLKVRFRLCINYIEIINYIHTVRDSPFVMCDTNTLYKTLEQYLFLDEYKIILNDIDALTRVETGGIVCGKKEILGNFVAPEQHWITKETPYNHSKMKKYDEKVDIWKIPSVCNYLLGNTNAAISVKFHLFPINRKCLEKKSTLRPQATDLLLFYKNVYNIFFNKEEL